MIVEIVKGQLVIKMDLDANAPLSKSGKTRLVACSNGWKGTSLKVDGKDVSVNVMATIKA